MYYRVALNTYIEYRRGTEITSPKSTENNNKSIQISKKTNKSTKHTSQKSQEQNIVIKQLQSKLTVTKPPK